VRSRRIDSRRGRDQRIDLRSGFRSHRGRGGSCRVRWCFLRDRCSSGTQRFLESWHNGCRLGALSGRRRLRPRGGGGRGVAGRNKQRAAAENSDRRTLAQ
jgi:hypothetical protein